MTPLQYLLWLAPKGLQVILIVRLFRSGLFRKLEVFTIYNTYTVAKTALLYVWIAANWRNYGWVYWSLQWLEFLIVVALVSESLAIIVNPFRSIQGKIKTTFRWLLPLCLIAAAAGLAMKPGKVELQILSRLVALDWILIALALAAIVLVFALCRSFGIGLRRQASAILLGIGTYVGVDLIGINSLYHRLGLSPHAYDLIMTSVNALMITYWVYVFCLAKEPVAPPAGGMKDEREKVREWAEEISGIVGARK